MEHSLAAVEEMVLYFSFKLAFCVRQREVCLPVSKPKPEFYFGQIREIYSVELKRDGMFLLFATL